MVDLGDGVVLPGLVEPHTHPDLCAQCYEWVDVSGFTHSATAVEQALREAVARAPRGRWIYAFGLDFMLTPDLGTWDRARLDALAPAHPLVVVIQSLHTAFANSLALRQAGLDETTPDPGRRVRPRRRRPPDRQGRGGSGHHAAPRRRRFLARGVRHAGAPAARPLPRTGITTIGMPGMFVPPPFLEIYEQLAPTAPLRTVAYLREPHIDAIDRAPGSGAERFRLRGVKVWYDGSPYSGTMLLDQPYLESELCCCPLHIAPGTVGYANHDRDALLPRCAATWRAAGRCSPTPRATAPSARCSTSTRPCSTPPRAAPTTAGASSTPA
ncbi:MAG: amidohydrolase family protein [Candidatus Binatia bacterium]